MRLKGDFREAKTAKGRGTGAGWTQGDKGITPGLGL